MQPNMMSGVPERSERAHTRARRLAWRCRDLAPLSVLLALFACGARSIDSVQPSSDASTAPDAGGDASVPLPVTTALQPLLPVPAGSFYPRALRRSNGVLIASVVTKQASGHVGGTILESTDDALSFHVIGAIDEPLASGGLCCATLFELPKAVGELPVGALLWSASVGGDQAAQPMALPVWSSVDGGRTWSPLSTAYVAGVPHAPGKGLWEPEFSMLDDGTLVCHFSDETDPAHSQKLAAVRTSDGITWGARKDTVALPTAGYRAGMASVRPGPGTFFMSYEVCGVPGDSCTAHLRMSADGWDWGDPTNIGLRPSTVDGKYFQHAPTLAWSSAPGQEGRLFLVGQVTLEASGQVAAENGNFVMANAEAGKNFWYGIPAPAPVVPAPYDNFCPNYSSALVPLDDGAVGLEVSSRWDGAICRSYFARGPLLGTGDATGVQSGSTYRLVNTQSAMCLDVASGSLAAGGRVQQWTCDGTGQQRWTFARAAEGTFSLTAQNSGLCLSPAAGAQAAGTMLEQDPCDGSAVQSWTLHNVGVGSYELLHSRGLCLDDAGGSTTAGGTIQEWTCNDRSPQIWHVEEQ